MLQQTEEDVSITTESEQSLHSSKSLASIVQPHVQVTTPSATPVSEAVSLEPSEVDESTQPHMSDKSQQCTPVQQTHE